mmetsp:Transcript_23480/g.54243  ORF Transcript_23480/g.54243 Transcript_23480/m.54243 type:complete len:206 (-) Transcript_23480:793-1410(-)
MVTLLAMLGVVITCKFRGVFVDSDGRGDDTSSSSVAQLPNRLRALTDSNGLRGLDRAGNIEKPHRGHLGSPEALLSESSSMLSKCKLGMIPIRSEKACVRARGSEPIPVLERVSMDVVSAMDVSWPLMTFSNCSCLFCRRLASWYNRSQMLHSGLFKYSIMPDSFITSSTCLVVPLPFAKACNLSIWLFTTWMVLSALSNFSCTP